MNKHLNFLIIFGLFLTSCASDQMDSLVNIQNKNINSQIICRIAPMGNTYKTGEPIFLELKYNSKDEITLPYDYGIRIFSETSAGWVEVSQTQIHRGSTEDIILSPDKNLPLVQIVMVVPDLEPQYEKINLRIYIIGHMTMDGKSNSVASMTKIALTPK